MAALRLALLLSLAAPMLVFAPGAGAIVGGHLDANHEYVVFVGQRVIYETPSGTFVNVGGAVCSGSLVGPTVVVTAAHCALVPPPPPSVPPGSRVVAVGYVVRQGPSVLDPTSSFLAMPGALHVQDGFRFGAPGVTRFSADDLAVVELAGALPPPYARLPHLDAASAVAPKGELAVVGYGISQTHGNEPITASFDGRRRQASARLLRNGAVAADLLHFEAGTCRGDSGGPLLDGDVVLGVVSFAPSSCKSTNYATRLDTPDSLRFLSRFGVSP